jgi:hypothetical protein
MPSKLSENSSRLPGLRRYVHGSDEDAVKLAHQDLLLGKDYVSNPKPGSKMYAVDFLRQAAMWAPELVTEQITCDCQRVFDACNDSSRLGIICIIGLLRRTDALPFLEEVRDDPTRPNVSRVLRKEGGSVLVGSRDDDAADWVRDAAIEALQVLRGEIEIARGQTPGRWIYTFNPDQR